MPKITPCLWFNGNAEEAVQHYCAIFKNSRVKSVSHYTDGMPMPVGTLLVVMLELDGQEIMLLNGGADFPFSEALSLYINCETQEEVDWFWEQLSAGGEEGQCGWLKDKFGVSWQVVPTFLDALIYDPDPVKARRVTRAMLDMQKIDIAALQRAHDGNKSRTSLDSDLPKLSGPARRALAGAGIRSLEDLAGYCDEEIRQLHGIGPNALETLRAALSACGLTFKKEA